MNRKRGKLIIAETTGVVEKKEETAVQHINKVTDFSLGIFGTSDNFTMAYQMAKALSQSTLVPREYQKSEANCMIATSMTAVYILKKKQIKTESLLVVCATHLRMEKELTDQ